MTEIETLHDVDVKLIDHMGNDAAIAQAARVSVVGENDNVDTSSDAGLINYLLREKHGSPFEHTTLKFYVEAPIFVFREFHRHRVGFSYNEMSGRYTTLPPRFYVPYADRPLRNIGTSARPEMAPGTPEQIELMYNESMDAYEEDWARYQRLLAAGIANEIARIHLPVGIMSQMYVTMNVRSALNFLALRTSNAEATFKSRPQLEIEMVAKKIETELEKLFPAVYAAWNKHGRVAP